MKLYAWQPSGYGPQSLFVAAESEDAARDAVAAWIADQLAHTTACDYPARYDCEREHPTAYDFDGWPDGYTLTVLEPGAVITNGNE